MKLKSLFYSLKKNSSKSNNLLSMHIHWLVPFKIDDMNQLKNTNLASTRLRLGCVIQNIDLTKFNLSAGPDIEDNIDCLVVGKLRSNFDQDINIWIDRIRKARSNNAKIILDYTDNYIDQNDNFYQPLYEKLIPLAHEIVTSSDYLKLKVQEKFKGPIEVIEDPIEINLIEPRIKNQDFCNILWFGHNSNIDYLANFINNWKDIEKASTLIMLTNKEGLIRFNEKLEFVHNYLSIKAGIWSVNAMIDASKFCDVAMIPSDLNDPRKSGVSANRLITALALGLPTAADMLESYKKFNKYFVDIRSENFCELLKKPKLFHKQVLKAQTMIIPDFSKEAIYKKWKSVFMKIKGIIKNKFFDFGCYLIVFNHY